MPAAVKLAFGFSAEPAIDLGDNDARAFAAEPLGEGKTKPAPRPGYYDTLAGKSFCHGPYPRRSDALAFGGDGILKKICSGRGRKA